MTALAGDEVFAVAKGREYWVTETLPERTRAGWELDEQVVRATMRSSRSAPHQIELRSGKTLVLELNRPRTGRRRSGTVTEDGRTVIQLDCVQERMRRFRDLSVKRLAMDITVDEAAADDPDLVVLLALGLFHLVPYPATGGAGI